jgi:hypothetical protein
VIVNDYLLPAAAGMPRPRARIRRGEIRKVLIAAESSGRSKAYNVRIGDPSSWMKRIEHGDPVGAPSPPLEQPHDVAVAAHLEPIAVVLDLVRPAGSRRHLVREGGDAGRDVSVGTKGHGAIYRLAWVASNRQIAAAAQLWTWFNVPRR